MKQPTTTRRPVLMAMTTPKDVDDNDDLDPLGKKRTIRKCTHVGEEMRRNTTPEGRDADAAPVLALRVGALRGDLAVHDTWETWTLFSLLAPPCSLGLFYSILLFLCSYSITGAL